MINLSRDILSLSHFKRKTSELMEQLKESGDPVVLTVNGKAELVVQDAAAYQRLVEKTEEVDALEGIHRGLQDVKRGRTRPARQAIDEIRRKRKIPRKA
ncbi:MAG TPA: type II toxin-antitoxin system Phd/YefM family antitoxin [Tepidisphaeraceae bacterium]|jgi:prevent-host-death family protein